MANLSVEDKVTTAQSLSSQVKIKYSQYYTGGASVDTALVACHTSLDSRLTLMNTKTLGALAKQTSPGTSPMVAGGALTCNLSKYLDFTELMNGWSEGIAALADGVYLDKIITDLTRLMASTCTLVDIRTTICGASTYIDAKNSMIDSLISSLDKVGSLIQEIQYKISNGMGAISCDAILNTVAGNSSVQTSAKAVFAKFNPNMSQAILIKEHVTEIAGDASQSIKNAIMTETTLINGNYEAQVTDTVTALNDGVYGITH